MKLLSFSNFLSLAALLLMAGSLAPLPASAQEDGNRLIRIDLEFTAPEFLPVGHTASPLPGASGHLSLTLAALPGMAMQIVERPQISDMAFNVGEVYFLPGQTSAFVNLLNGQPIKIVIGGAVEGPHGLSGKINDFRIVFGRAQGSGSGDLGVEEIVVTFFDQPGRSYVARDPRGRTTVVPLPPE